MLNLINHSSGHNPESTLQATKIIQRYNDTFVLPAIAEDLGPLEEEEEYNPDTPAIDIILEKAKWISGKRPKDKEFATGFKNTFSENLKLALEGIEIDLSVTIGEILESAEAANQLLDVLGVRITSDFDTYIDDLTIEELIRQGYIDVDVYNSYRKHLSNSRITLNSTVPQLQNFIRSIHNNPTFKNEIEKGVRKGVTQSLNNFTRWDKNTELTLKQVSNLVEYPSTDVHSLKSRRKTMKILNTFIYILGGGINSTINYYHDIEQ